MPRPGRASDGRLARRAAGGDADAFAAIFSRYEQDLYRFCVGILGEPQDAQDAVQNTMVKALRALPGERREMQLKPWLYRIAHNEAIELRRRERPTEPLSPAVGVRGPDLDERLAHHERLRRLFEDMADLPDRQRATLVMRELNGLGFGEIGAALGTSPGAIRQALYEARRGLERMRHGREMECELAARRISDADGDPGDREIRAHVRECRHCRRFQAEIRDRGKVLSAISPLPAVAAAALLKSALGGSGGAAGAGAGLAGAGGAGAGATAGGAGAGAIGGSAVAKSLATVLAVAAIGGTADRSGLVSIGDSGQPGEAAAASQAPPQSGSSRSPDGFIARQPPRPPRGAPAAGRDRPHRGSEPLPAAAGTRSSGRRPSAPPATTPGSVAVAAAQGRSIGAPDSPEASAAAPSHEPGRPAGSAPPGQVKTGTQPAPAGQVEKEPEPGPPGEAKKGAESKSPGQVRHEAGTEPPGQAKKEARSEPPGQAKKEEAGPEPPGQAKKEAKPETAPPPAPPAEQTPETSAPPAAEAPPAAPEPRLPPGRAKPKRGESAPSAG